MRVVLTGGGTGGHLIPFEPIVEAIRAYYLQQKESLPADIDPSTLDISYLGPVDDKTREFFTRYDVTVVPVPSGKLRRYASLKTLVDLGWWLPLGCCVACFQLWRRMPDVIVSKGGYGSLPVVLLGAWYRIPILLHESDVVPGLANRILARFATVITLGFAQAEQALTQYAHKLFFTGTPVRVKFNLVEPAAAKEQLGFAADELVLLILGGSQGAAQLNEILLQILPRIIVDMGVIHVTGPSHFTKISAVASELLASSARKDAYKPFAYLDEAIYDAYGAADAVVSRAGATTLAELTRLRKPMLLIPLDSSANDHQRRNAALYESLGAAYVLDPANLGVNLFERAVRDLAANAKVREQFSRQLAQLDRPQAAQQMAELAFVLARQLAPRGADE